MHKIKVIKFIVRKIHRKLSHAKYINNSCYLA